MVTKLISLVTLSVFLSLFPSAFAFAEDSLFENVQMVEFPNGFKLILAPSDESRIVGLALEVDVGWDVETKENWGVSHLLEHSVFRDIRLKDDTTYLQLIEENGGSANGFTQARKTIYKAVIKSNKSNWLLDQYFKMITNRTFVQDHIDKEKQSVLLEIGKPGVIASLLGFDLFAKLKPKNLSLPDFWESEFGAKLEDHGFSQDEERLSTLTLTAEQIFRHYKDYYHPSNMRIFIAGDFDKSQVIKKITESWGQIPVYKGKTLPPIEKINPTKHPYVRTKVANETPSISYGTKAWDLTREDEEILEMYMNFVSHKLMKELRNKKGQTYSVVPSSEFNERFGYAILNFETQPANFSENFSLVKNLINEQTLKSGLSAEEFEEAKNLYLQKYDLNDANSETMLGIAELYFYYHRFYKDTRSPHEILGLITPEGFNARLQLLFDPQKRYSFNHRPPYLFRYEQLVLLFGVFLLSLMLIKKFLTQPFDHSHLKWMRKVSYPPFKVVEIFLFVVAFYLFTYVEFFVVDLPFYKLSFLSDSLAYGEYLPDAVSTFILTSMILGFYASYPKRLFIIDSELVIKSITYFSRHVSLSEIESIETKYSFNIPWLKVFPRFYFLRPLWNRGLLVNLKNGRSWFFGVSDPENARREILRYLPKPFSESSMSPRFPLAERKAPGEPNG
ncbi:MAG: pitrilysin family protein [Pseudomonadota bacterium]|nr:pitrilysin family protein [Pseudomonadota bacterium]